MNKTVKKTLSTSIKIGISFLLLWFVYSKVSFVEIWETIKSIKAYCFFLAILFYGFSQIISARRLLLCFRQMNFDLSSKSNYLLYLIGMFYNFFVPGGIGGDAYKVYILNNQFKWKAKKLSAVVIADRATGLIAICCWIVILFFGIEDLYEYYSKLWLPILLIVGILLGKFLFKIIFPTFYTIYLKLLGISFVIQGLQLITVYLILESMGQTNQLFMYFIIFFISSLLSIFSFAGIGIREFIFLKFAHLYNFEETTAVSIGALFTIISLIISLPGIYPIVFSKKKMYLKNENENF